MRMFRQAAHWKWVSRVALTVLAIILILPLRTRAEHDPNLATATGFVERNRLIAILAAILVAETGLVVGLVRGGDRRGPFQQLLDRGFPVRRPASDVSLALVRAPADVTGRRRVEQAPGELSRRLIVAQEEERRRIARELHDHLNQQLALLAIDLQQLSIAAPSNAFSGKLDELWRRTNDICSEVHELSHRLHPSKLEALGLVTTIRGHCRDISRRGVAVQFADHDTPPGIPPDISLCLFRIVEEALSNVVRHSQAKEAQVTLEEVDCEIVLRIADAGRGFAPAMTSQQRGLGLVSMRERLGSVGGTLMVESMPGQGAVIEARIPTGAVTSARRPAAPWRNRRRCSRSR